jgi:hypothetical protein
MVFFTAVLYGAFFCVSMQDLSAHHCMVCSRQTALAYCVLQCRRFHHTAILLVVYCIAREQPALTAF